ncbi:MAG: hypothetical protein EA378_06115 [Phycisphaerales bacterium]|nr:MAG: hypothetical protein EA378_06115 [Phycisphaerales bacterium]
MTQRVAVVVGSLVVLGFGLALGGCASAQGGTPEERRTYAMDMRETTLEELHNARPATREEIRNAAGYGVFSAIGTNVIFVTTGGGYGVVTNNRTGEETYMRMGEVGVGIGLGVKDFRAVFVFHDEDTLNRFVETGWEFGADADAAAKAGDQGGAASAGATSSRGISVYQFTENGIVLGASVSGTRYWRDRRLN